MREWTCLMCNKEFDRFGEYAKHVLDKHHPEETYWSSWEEGFVWR